MSDLIKSDLFRYSGKVNRFSFFKNLITKPGFRFTFFLRKVSGCNKYSLKGIFYGLFYRRYMYKYGFQIPRKTSIGKGLYIGHFGTLIINEMATIGDNCNLSPNVTIGMANRGKYKGCPSIGSRVWIGTGAIIIGKVVIGDNVLIAPNSYVNFDVPSDCIVIGNPGKVIPKKDATLNYINNIVSDNLSRNYRK